MVLRDGALNSAYESQAHGWTRWFHSTCSCKNSHTKATAQLSLTSQGLVMRSKLMEITRPHSVPSYGITPGVHTVCSLSTSLDPLTCTWLANNVQQMLMWSKLSALGRKQLTLITSMPGHQPWIHCDTNAYVSIMTMWRSEASSATHVASTHQT